MAAHSLQPWIAAAAQRLHHNVLAIALANKLARIAWSVLHHGRNFEVSKISESNVPTRLKMARPCQRAVVLDVVKAEPDGGRKSGQP